MKKTIISLLIVSAMFITLTGCRKTEIHPAEDEIVIALDISDVSDTIYAADIGYSLDGKLVGSMGCCNADGSPLKDIIRFSLEENVFPENSDTEHLSFNVMLYGDKDGASSSSGKIKKTAESITFSPSYGNIYGYSITGSFAEGFALSGAKR